MLPAKVLPYKIIINKKRFLKRAVIVTVLFKNRYFYAFKALIFSAMACANL